MAHPKANKTSFKKGEAKGKPKGAVNKETKIMRTVKETVLNAFNNLQEDPVANIEAWGRENPKDFYNIAAKLIPTELQGTIQVKKAGQDLANENYV